MKRPEEGFKFVFKRCIEHMRMTFENSSEASLSDALEKRFYEHYFLKISQEKQIPLEKFYLPRSYQEKDSKIPKSFTREYIRNISKSKQFTEEFFGYIDNQLIEKTRKVLEQRVEALIIKWQRQLNNYTENDSSIRQICLGLEVNKKAKLPWTVKEINIAIKRTKDLFEMHRKD